MEDPTEPSWHGYVYAAGLFLSTFLGAMCSTHFNYLIQIVGLKIRAAIITSIYRKSVLVSSVSLSTFSVGEIINFMSTDVDRIVNFCPSFHNFWSLPFQIAVSLYLLHQQIGLAFLAGLAFAILLIPINRWIAIKIAQLSTSMMSQKDGRVKVMNELLTGIRIIKFYVWEGHFRKKVGALREAELASLRGRKYLDALCVYFWATTPVLISILTFTTYALLGHRLTAAKVFTSMALFNILIMPLNAFPWVINGLMEAWVSVQRVQLFLQLPELDHDRYYAQSQPVEYPGANSNPAVIIQQAQFSWRMARELQADHSSYEVTSDQSDVQDGLGNSVANARSSTQKLTNINLNIQKETLLATVKRRKLSWFGHTTRHNTIVKTILQGTLDGKRQQGHQRKTGKTIYNNGHIKTY
ncbi:Multidrug resistance-associated protein 7 [Lamellibrachia satsuma]|nr:Multidrug resistance-associated protein 7 [Lamellibrachia satsuma]